jgi:hypothetical protein
MPMLMRHVSGSEDRYRLLGICYVHGLCMEKRWKMEEYVLNTFLCRSAGATRSSVTKVFVDVAESVSESYVSRKKE